MANNGRKLGKLNENVSKVTVSNLLLFIDTTFRTKPVNGNERQQLISLGKRFVELSFGSWRKVKPYIVTNAIECTYCGAQSDDISNPKHEPKCMYRAIISKEMELNDD